MAGQLPPDVLEDLMLMEAMNPGDAPGIIPGGFGDIQEEDEDAEAMNGMVEVNFNVGAGFAAPAAPVPAGGMGIAENARRAADGADEQDQGDEDEDGEDDEEEYISVSIYLIYWSLFDYNLRCISLCPVCYGISWEDFGDKARKWKSHLLRTRRRGIIQVSTDT